MYNSQQTVLDSWPSGTSRFKVRASSQAREEEPGTRGTAGAHASLKIFLSGEAWKSPFPTKLPCGPPRPDFRLHLAVPPDFMSLRAPTCAPGPGAGGPVLMQYLRGAGRGSDPLVRVPALPLTSYNVVKSISLSLGRVIVQNNRLF